MSLDPQPDDTPLHIHRRGEYCPWLLPKPLRPRKPAAIWLYEWATAIEHLETFEEFVEANPDEFLSFWAVPS